MKERTEPQLVVKLLENEVTDVEPGAGRSNGIGGFDLFCKVDPEL